jgi:hypothetical protein
MLCSPAATEVSESCAEKEPALGMEGRASGAWPSTA